MDREHINVFLQISRSLLQARDKLKEDRSIPPQIREQAIRILTETYIRNRYDLKLRQIQFHMGPQEMAKLLRTLHSFLPEEATLGDFARTPWATIQDAFDAAQYTCPLALREFHAQYEQDLRDEAPHHTRPPYPAPTSGPGAGGQ